VLFLHKASISEGFTYTEWEMKFAKALPSKGFKEYF
jgi:hypothetical protein